MRNDWKDVFLSSVGRIPRGPFLIASIVLVAFTAAYEDLASSLIHWITGWMVYPVLVYCGVSVMAKRLHDRGRAAWWSGFVLLAIWILCAQAPLPLAIPAWVVIGWALIEMGLMPSQRGPNAFGPDPTR